MGLATGDAMAFAGMQPRPVVERVDPSSSAYGKLQKDDIVLAVSANGETSNYPTAKVFTDRVIAAGKAGAKITITVLRGGQELVVPGLAANVYIDGLTRGLGISVRSDLDHAVLSQPLSDSPAAAIPAGSAIRQVNGVEVAAWSDVLRELRKAQAGKPVTITAVPPLTQAAQQYTLSLTPADVTTLASMRYSVELALRDMRDSRTTTNPLVAAWWGITETRDSILQVYLTLSRLIEGSVPKTGVVGPLGMFQMGTQIASQGVDYLLWFLAIISANLAVVNFLPIPVVDGGHFLFLAIEKLRGRPVSERTMVVAQWCGLALIGFVFVFVTYQDILRLITVKM
jgi:regulator of sigma E protease